MLERAVSIKSDIPLRYAVESVDSIETIWQDRREIDGTFNADNPIDALASPEAGKGEFSLLDMFSYPSGKGLHVGYPLGYIAIGVAARFTRMTGENVLYAMGHDAFDPPAEQYAVTTGQHPCIFIEANIANMRRQLCRLGPSHDPYRSPTTISVDYICWIQWIFLQVLDSWLDPEASRCDGRGKDVARPVTELRDKFASGQVLIPGSRGWDVLNVAEQAEVTDSFRLTYVSSTPVNWCPGLGTALISEEVISEGRSERGNYPVFKRDLCQRMMHITVYGDHLAENLDAVNQPKKVKLMQRNWTGRPKGAEMTFTVPGVGQGDQQDTPLSVYTARLDTLFGAIFVAAAPGYPTLDSLRASGLMRAGAQITDDAAALTAPIAWPEGTREAWTGGYATPTEVVAAYRAQTAAASDTDRTGEDRIRIGASAGLFGIGPTNGVKVPVFMAGCMLMGYGTGAIMVVSVHGEHDYTFVTKCDIDIVQTISSADDPHGADLGAQVYIDNGVVVNFAQGGLGTNDMGRDEAKAIMIGWLEVRGVDRGVVICRLCDQPSSRQRYWGGPLLIVWDEGGSVHALPGSMLPIELPEVTGYSLRPYDPDSADPSLESPLGKVTERVGIEPDLGDDPQAYYCETNTTPQWAGSCRYKMRYTDLIDDRALVDPTNEAYWIGPHPQTGNILSGTDLCVGGIEHTVLCLPYACLRHKVLFGLGHVSSSEPYHRLFDQGYVQTYTYIDVRGQYILTNEVEEVTAEGGSTNHL